MGEQPDRGDQIAQVLDGLAASYTVSRQARQRWSDDRTGLSAGLMKLLMQIEQGSRSEQDSREPTGSVSGCRLKDLAALAGLDASTVSRETAHLIALGLVERRSDLLDGRAARLALTEQGRERLRSLQEAVLDQLAQACASWEPGTSTPSPRPCTDSPAASPRSPPARSPSCLRPPRRAHPKPLTSWRQSDDHHHRPGPGHGPATRDDPPADPGGALRAAARCCSSRSCRSTIVSNALPQIIGDLDGTQTAYTWVVTATLLAATATTPIWGKLADLFSKKLLVQIAIVIFVVGSVVAGLSPDHRHADRLPARSRASAWAGCRPSSRSSSPR